MKKILLTGGGTAGHVTPNIALLPDLKAEGYDIHYIGSYEGMEKKLITAQGIHYDGIATGKFRRYLSAKNLTDPFRVIKGFQQAKKLIRDYKPDVVFSKGGFVAVPVVLAAGHYHIPVIIHESDMTPGLANKICMRTAKKICCNFPETVKLLPALPSATAWQSGHIRGLAVKGGWTIDIEWKKGKVVKYDLHPGNNSIQKDQILLFE